MKTFLTLTTPLGPLSVGATAEAVTDVVFGNAPAGAVTGTTPLLRESAAQLTAYFTGERTAFELPLAPAGTPFQQTVWRALLAVPYGCTGTYAEIAAAVGHPRACRAVGMANHRNPLPIIVPCHRIVGADGRRTGYAGGLERKRTLLELERRHMHTTTD